jgi:hypothetical protein
VGGCLKRVTILLGLWIVGACQIEIPSGIFGCEDNADCPADQTCLANRCTALKCEGETWEQIAALVGQGAQLDCGDLWNSCGELVPGPQCPEGESCGENFTCKCEEVTCVSYGDEGAQCGLIPSVCEPGTFISCGECAGSQELCEDHQCVCPAGAICDQGCPGGCSPGESCVDGVCCVQEFPCQSNECSPALGLPNGCGQLKDCGSCDPERGESCQLETGSFSWTCLDCCEANGFECGVCDDILCGQCDLGEQCEDGRCVRVCEDRYEPNDRLDDAAVLCTTACASKEWSVSFDAILDQAGDQDYFAFVAAHTNVAAIAMKLEGSIEGKEMTLRYTCPDGDNGLNECSGSLAGSECREDSTETVWISRKCSGVGSAVVVASLRNQSGSSSAKLCAPYTLRVWSFSLAP